MMPKNNTEVTTPTADVGISATPARKSARVKFTLLEEEPAPLDVAIVSAAEREKQLSAVSRNPKIMDVARQMAGGTDVGLTRGQHLQGVETFQDCEYAVGSTYEIPVQHLLPNPQNARKLPQPGHKLDELAQSLATQQHVAANAFVTAEGSVMLIDGHRRWSAAKSAGLPTLRVEIRPAPANDRELYLTSRAANSEREPQGILDDALMFKQLLDQGVFENQASLGQALNIDEGELSRILGLNKLTLKVMQYINAQPIALNLHLLNALRQYQEVAGEDETKSLVDRIGKEGVSAREIERLRKAFGQERSTRVRSDTKAMYTYDKGRATVRQFEVTRRLVLEVGEVAPGVSLEHIAEVLRKTLQSVMGGEGGESGN